MKALVINCSPVKTGATAEIVRIIAASMTTISLSAKDAGHVIRPPHASWKMMSGS